MPKTPMGFNEAYFDDLSLHIMQPDYSQMIDHQAQNEHCGGQGGPRVSDKVMNLMESYNLQRSKNLNILRML